jgi:DNA polymerase (family 10)
MPGHNADIAAIFDEIADLLELEEANPFRVRAYHNAVRIIRDLSRDVTGLGAAGEDHTELLGVGEHLAGKIRERAAVSSLSRPTAGVCRAC